MSPPAGAPSSLLLPPRSPLPLQDLPDPRQRHGSSLGGGLALASPRISCGLLRRGAAACLPPLPDFLASSIWAGTRAGPSRVASGELLGLSVPRWASRGAEAGGRERPLVSDQWACMTQLHGPYAQRATLENEFKNLSSSRKSLP